MLSQRIAGGDLVSLLRRYADAAAARERARADARSATAQARFTGLLVAAMPAGAALLAELLAPGFVTGLLRNGASLALLAVAGGAPGGRIRGDQAPGAGGGAVSPVLAGLAGLLVFAAAWELAGFGPPAAARRMARRLDVDRAVLVAQARGSRGGRRRFRGNRAGRAGTSRARPRGGRWSRRASSPRTPMPSAPRDDIGPGSWQRCRTRSTSWPSELPRGGHLRRCSGRSRAGREGALAAELAITVAEIETGSPVAGALERLRDRTGASELGALAAALDRSRRYGSPLADQLHAQAATLRREERRRIEELAARAAPQIQLVVALVLVPSALLAIAAALIAHSDSLFGASR